MKEKKKRESKMKKGKRKIVSQLIKIFLRALIIVCIAYNILFVTYTTIRKTEYWQFLGFSIFCMKTELMHGDIEKNELVLIRNIDTQNLKNGDIIAYQINGKVRINKIVKKQESEFTTKSNKNYNPDIEKITKEQIIGREIATIPFLGIILRILESKITTFIILSTLIFKLSRNKYLQDKKRERIRKKIVFENTEM